MARLFLIRHGEPEAAWGGPVDDPGLTEKGCAQARAAAEALMRKGTLEVVSSPMRRCLETAAPYAELSGVAVRDGRWFGEVETPRDVADRRAWLRENFPWSAGATPRGWSSVAQDVRAWRERVLSAACRIEKDTAVFTHFIATNAIVGFAMESAQTIVFRPDHASITELEVSPERLSVRRLGKEMDDGEVR